MRNKYSYNFFERVLFGSLKLNRKKLTQKIKGKIILITGASYGIGEKLCYNLAIPGVTIILVARTKEKLIFLKNKIEEKGAKAIVFSANLYEKEEVDKFIDFLAEEDLKPDIFISNAGKSIKRSIFESFGRFHDFSRTMSINYFAPVKILLFLIPVLMDKKGQIINISSMTVLLPPVNYWAAYSASKIAFDTWLKSVEPELDNLTISSFYLPLVRTRMILPTKSYDKMPAMKPEHVADLVCNAIIKNKKKYSPWWTIFAKLTALVFPNKWKSYS